MLAGASETVSPSHTALLNQCIKKIKDTGSRLSGDHKELHGMVSKVGKAIDKVCFWLILDRSSCEICWYYIMYEVLLVDLFYFPAFCYHPGSKEIEQDAALLGGSRCADCRPSQ